jgi:hypothetical protein
MAISLEPHVSPPPVSLRRILVAIAAPLAGVGTAYLLWQISDRLLYIGPVDRATFGWLVVVPVWALSPLLAALVWGRLATKETYLAAAALGLTIAVVAAILFWFALAFPQCDFGALRTPVEWIGPAAVVGMVVGGGFAAICLLTLAVARGGHRLRALLTAAGSAFGLIFATVLVAVPFVLSGGCMRPPI